MEKEIKEIQEFYNAISQKFADEWYANDCLLPVLKQFISLLPSNPCVLDLGCGAGYESMRLRKLGAKVVGIDYCEEPIKIARQKNPDCQFEVMDFRNLRTNIGKFHGIVSIASIIHINDDELKVVFENMKKVMKPQGFLMLIYVEGQGISKELSIVESDGIQYNRPFYLHSKVRLNDAAHDNGLEYFNELNLNEELKSFGWKCFLYKSL